MSLNIIYRLLTASGVLVKVVTHLRVGLVYDESGFALWINYRPRLGHVGGRRRSAISSFTHPSGEDAGAGRLDSSGYTGQSALEDVSPSGSKPDSLT